MNKQSCQFFVWPVPQAQSSLVQRLIQACLSPTSHFALVSFQSHLFLLHLLLSSLILSLFLLLLSNLCTPTVSFHSSAPGWPCPPHWCDSASILKANWKKDYQDPLGLKIWRFRLQCKKCGGLTEEKYHILVIMAQNASHIVQGSLNAIMDFSKSDLGGCRTCAT